MQPGIKHLSFLAAAYLLAATAASAAGYRTQVGYDQLVKDYGSNLPDGSNLTILQVEAPDGSGAWATAATKELAGKAITFPYSTTTPTVFSAHANIVATNLIGSVCSLIPGTPGLLCSGASTYRNSSLFMAKCEAPPIATWDLENHSYAGNATTYNTNALQLLDYRVSRDLITVVVALENGTNPVPPLFANTYNTIAVGVSSGAHSRGGSTMEVVGRMKPDLVAAASYTSYATPMVSSAAGLLLSEAKRTSSLAAARDPRVVKALLMAGAVKTNLPTWYHTTAQPLDPVYGTGELNINNSYRMLMRGRQTAGASLKASDGWDFGKSGTTSTYYLQVPAGQTLTFSAVLAWHRELTTADFWTFTYSVPDLVLRLRNSTASFAKGTVIAESNSALDNVEHVFSTALPAGYYALEVAGPAGVAYGVAWHGEASGAPVTVAPTTATLPASATATTTQSVTMSASSSATAHGCAAEILRTSGSIDGSAQPLTTSFTITGQQRKKLLIRGISPDVRPVLSVVINGRRIGYNAGWRTENAQQIRAETARLGAIPLSETSLDCAVIGMFYPGTYTVTLRGFLKASGSGRIEILDATPETRSSLGDFAGTAFVGGGRPDLVAEVNVASDAPKAYSIRAHGRPGTAPLLAIFRDAQLLASGEESAAAGNNTAELTLSPGRHTVQVSGDPEQADAVSLEIVEVLR